MLPYKSIYNEKIPNDLNYTTLLVHALKYYKNVYNVSPFNT